MTLIFLLRGELFTCIPASYSILFIYYSIVRSCLRHKPLIHRPPTSLSSTSCSISVLRLSSGSNSRVVIKLTCLMHTGSRHLNFSFNQFQVQVSSVFYCSCFYSSFMHGLNRFLVGIICLLITQAADHELSFAVRSFCSCHDCKAAWALGTRIRP